MSTIIASMPVTEIPVSLIRKHYPALNGLRGVAILLVFLCHYGILFLPTVIAHSLWVGVDVFFALSGFLITGILIDAQGTDHFFRTFYIRRSLRIFPLYYGFFLLIALLTPILHLAYKPITWSFLLYSGNIALTFHHNPTVIYFRNSTIALGPLWTLCVEEQFYLLWPFLLSRLRSRKAIMRFCVVIIVATFLLRTALYFRNPTEVAVTHYLYFFTLTHWDTLFMGSWLAVWLRGVTLTPKQIRRIAYPLVAISFAILLAGGSTVGRRWPHNEVNPLLCTYGYDLIGFISVGVLLLAIDETSALHRILKNRALAALGVISYGFYFFHGMPMQNILYRSDFAHNGKFVGFLIALASFIAIYALAWLSFRFIESPFLRLKSRLAPPNFHKTDRLEHKRNIPSTLPGRTHSWSTTSIPLPKSYECPPYAPAPPTQQPLSPSSAGTTRP